MKSVSKKVLSVLLAAVLVLTVTVTAFASIVKAELNDDNTTATILGYTDVYKDEKIFDAGTGSLEIIGSEQYGPSTIYYTAVAGGAFSYEPGISDKEYLTEVKKITVDKNIKTIGEKAFANIPNLTEVVFRGDINIGKAAFENCPSLKKVIFEKSAFLGENAFAGCTALEEISVPENADFSAAQGALDDTAFFKSFDIDFVFIGSVLIAFKGNASSVTVPVNITKIASGAFRGNKTLEEVNIPKNTVSIGDEAFAGCENLRNVNFESEENISFIGKDAFAGTAFFNNFKGEFFIAGPCLLKYNGSADEVYIPNTVSAVAPGCFEGCFSVEENGTHAYNIKKIFVPASVRFLGENCFGLEKLADGSYYVPEIYAYAKTSANSEKLLKDAGYNPVLIPAPADVNADGVVSASDARKALRLTVGLEQADAFTCRAADIDCGGKVGADDARRILRIAVGLENYTAEELLFTPRTDYEILAAYSKAMAQAAENKAGYKKSVNSTFGDSDTNIQGKTYISNIIEKNGSENSSEEYQKGSSEAAANIGLCYLTDTSGIKKARCTLDGSKYKITIAFKDMPDNDGTSDILKVFPAQTRAHYEKLLNEKAWKNLPGTQIDKFDLTYNNASVTAVIDMADMQLESCELSLGYNFAFSGKILGLKLSSKNGSGDAEFNRTDVIRYYDFVF